MRRRRMENERVNDCRQAREAIRLKPEYSFLIDSWAWMRLTLNIIRGQHEKLFNLQTFAQVSPWIECDLSFSMMFRWKDEKLGWKLMEKFWSFQATRADFDRWLRFNFSFPCSSWIRIRTIWTNYQAFNLMIPGSGYWLSQSIFKDIIPQPLNIISNARSIT
jgi:hypothetical protein